MRNSVLVNNSSNLWHEIKKIKGHAKFTPCTIDNVTGVIPSYIINSTGSKLIGSKSIAAIFSDKFSNLYNSVGYSKD